MIDQSQAKRSFLFKWNRELLSSMLSVKPLEIATLGPSGTSSEASAKYLLFSLEDKSGKYSLYPSYEEAYESLILGTSNLLLVANAYKGIDKFYMSHDILFLFPFIFETPLYGVAKRRNEEVDLKRRLVIATHHAPSYLLPWFLSGLDVEYEMVFVNSTSEAAAKLQDGKVDLCLTTIHAAEKYNGEFISPMRTILMLWSVFGTKSTVVSFKR